MIGASGVPGIWLNLAHGGNGWALACGSSRALADMVLGLTPEIDMGGFGLERLRAAGDGDSGGSFMDKFEHLLKALWHIEIDKFRMP